MKQRKTDSINSCTSCGRPTPVGRIICKCCEKCNGYSAAFWLANHIEIENKALFKEKHSAY